MVEIEKKYISFVIKIGVNLFLGIFNFVRFVVKFCKF